MGKETHWDNDIKMITHLVILDSVHHDKLKLLCITEKRQTEIRHEELQHSDFDLACTISFAFGVYSVLGSVAIILRFVHLRAKNEKILGLQSVAIVGTYTEVKYN